MLRHPMWRNWHHLGSQTKDGKELRRRYASRSDEIVVGWKAAWRWKNHQGLRFNAQHNSSHLSAPSWWHAIVHQDFDWTMLRHPMWRNWHHLGSQAKDGKELRRRYASRSDEIVVGWKAAWRWKNNQRLRFNAQHNPSHLPSSAWWKLKAALATGWNINGS